MEIIDLKENPNFLREYIILCSEEWGKKKNKEEMISYVAKKEEKIHNGDKVISVLGLIEKETLLGFISLFKYEDDINDEYTPWYATMYVKKEYRRKGYSRLLNDALIKEAKRLEYDKVYLKTTLNNYYEKFGAKFVKQISDEEKLYCINLKGQN